MWFCTFSTVPLTALWQSPAEETSFLSKWKGAKAQTSNVLQIMFWGMLIHPTALSGQCLFYYPDLGGKSRLLGGWTWGAPSGVWGGDPATNEFRELYRHFQDKILKPAICFFFWGGEILGRISQSMPGIKTVSRWEKAMVGVKGRLTEGREKGVRSSWQIGSTL